MASLSELTPITLQGRYVRLEPLSQDHVQGLAAVGIDDEIWRLLPYGLMRSEDDIRRWVQTILRHAAEGTDLPFTVFHLASGRVAGATRYMEIRPSHRGLEIGGTWYGAEFRRTVVNTEAKYLLLKYAFEDLKCIRVQLKTDVRNVRSQQAIERIGARREGVLRNHMILPDGTVRDSAYYSILDTEWPAIRDKLELKLGT